VWKCGRVFEGAENNEVKVIANLCAQDAESSRGDPNMHSSDKQSVIDVNCTSLDAICLDVNQTHTHDVHLIDSHSGACTPQDSCTHSHAHMHTHTRTLAADTPHKHTKRHTPTHMFCFG
jgi:hypothetical protein